MMIRIYIPLLLLLVRFDPAFISAQPIPGLDTTRVDQDILGRYRGLFGATWSRNFAKLWNGNRDTAKALAGLGRVHFVSEGTETLSVLMNFDSTGQVSVIKLSHGAPTDTLPTFTTQVEKWAAFMEGKFHAVLGVLTGRIRFKGPFPVAFKYGVAFDKVAPIGRRAALFPPSVKK